MLVFDPALAVASPVRLSQGTEVVSPVPEPETLVLLIAELVVGMAGWRGKGTASGANNPKKTAFGPIPPELGKRVHPRCHNGAWVRCSHGLPIGSDRHDSPRATAHYANHAR